MNENDGTSGLKRERARVAVPDADVKVSSQHAYARRSRRGNRPLAIQKFHSSLKVLGGSGSLQYLRVLQESLFTL